MRTTSTFFATRGFVSFLCNSWSPRSWKKLAGHGYEEVLKTFHAFFQLPLYSDERRRLKTEIVNPLYWFITALSTNTSNLDATYIALTRAVGYLPDLPLKQARELIGATICLVTGITKTTNRNRSGGQASESNYDSFLRLIPASRTHFQYDLAHLQLLHPTRPSAEHALEILSEIHTQGPPRIRSRPERQEAVQKDIEDRTLHLGLNAAQFLLEHDQYREADKVMACLRSHFSTQLGLSSENQERLEDSEAEAASLEMLDNLRLA